MTAPQPKVTAISVPLPQITAASHSHLPASQGARPSYREYQQNSLSYQGERSNCKGLGWLHLYLEWPLLCPQPEPRYGPQYHLPLFPSQGSEMATGCNNYSLHMEVCQYVLGSVVQR